MKTRQIAARAEETALRYLANGTTAIRTHTDTGEGIGTRAVEAVLSVRAKLRSVIDLQVVAACSVPVTGVAAGTGRLPVRSRHRGRRRGEGPPGSTPTLRSASISFSLWQPNGASR